ncbi:MAG: cbb3-type cytochrome oxidase assembly protein CcoS [Sulfurimonas sp.]|nr:cbb3-type cytochrome oxidase assembly protein CcoS [Sulfurimonadaceae bacterium]
MDSWVVAMMLGASIFLGAIALVAFMWALKSGQFDDEQKFLNATKFDGVDELNEAAANEKKRAKVFDPKDM